MTYTTFPSLPGDSGAYVQVAGKVPIIIRNRKAYLFGAAKGYRWYGDAIGDVYVEKAIGIREVDLDTGQKVRYSLPSPFLDDNETHWIYGYPRTIIMGGDIKPDGSKFIGYGKDSRFTVVLSWSPPSWTLAAGEVRPITGQCQQQRPGGGPRDPDHRHAGAAGAGGKGDDGPRFHVKNSKGR